MKKETTSSVVEDKKISCNSATVKRDDVGWQKELFTYPDYLQEISYLGYDIGYGIGVSQEKEDNWIVAQSDIFDGEQEMMDRVVSQFANVVEFFVNHGGNYDIQVLRLTKSPGNVIYLGSSLSTLYLTPKALRDSTDNPSLFEAGLLHELIHLKREQDESASPEDELTAYWASFVYPILKGDYPFNFDEAGIKKAREDILPRVKKEICEDLSLDEEVSFDELVKAALDNKDKLEAILEKKIAAICSS